MITKKCTICDKQKDVYGFGCIYKNFSVKLERWDAEGACKDCRKHLTPFKHYRQLLHLRQLIEKDIFEFNSLDEELFISNFFNESI